MTYTGDSVGDILFTASINSLSDSLTVEDTIAYKLEEQSITGTSSSDTWVELPPSWSVQDCELTFDLYTTGNKFEIGFHHTNPQIWCCFGKSYNGTSTVYGQSTDGSDATSFSTPSFPYNTWHTGKIRIIGTHIYAYFNDVLVRDFENTDLSLVDDLTFAICTWVNGVTVKSRNIKVKPLTS